LSAERLLRIKRSGYLAVVSIAAAVFLVCSLLFFEPPAFTREVVIAVLVLSAVSFFLELGIDFRLLISGSTSFSTVSYMAMIFLLPFPIPPIAGALVVLVSDIRSRKRWFSLIFNAANYVLTFGITSLIWHLYSGGRTLVDLPLSFVTFFVVTMIIVVFYVLNVFLLNGYLSIINQRPITYIWITQDLGFLLPYLSLEVVGVLVALVWQTSPSIIPLLIVPAVTTYLAFETIERLQQQTQQAMISMADAIDARDTYTAEHSRRVAVLARRIAEVYGLKAREIERIELAARLHDIGKVGINDHILNKAGPLTDEEWAIMKQHPVLGAEMLKPYKQFRNEVAIVHAHHERWDGRGYPDNVRGQQIPIGARIISVADTFDAMTSSRPYRPALSRQTAVEEIRKNALIQFDPQVVASFLQVMEEMTKVRPITMFENRDKDGVEEEHAWYSSLP
jgi:putative nucleotidyltransferase with HDIG domain